MLGTRLLLFNSSNVRGHTRGIGDTAVAEPRCKSGCTTAAGRASAARRRPDGRTRCMLHPRHGARPLGAAWKCREAIQVVRRTSAMRKRRSALLRRRSRKGSYWYSPTAAATPIGRRARPPLAPPHCSSRLSSNDQAKGSAGRRPQRHKLQESSRTELRSFRSLPPAAPSAAALAPARADDDANRGSAVPPRGSRDRLGLAVGAFNIYHIQSCIV